MVYKNNYDFIPIPVPLMKIDAGAKKGHMHELLKFEAYRINIFWDINKILLKYDCTT